MNGSFWLPGYFTNVSAASNLTTAFSELTPKVLDSLTFDLESQVDAFLSSQVMSAKELMDHIGNGTGAKSGGSKVPPPSTGSRRRKAESETLKRALEEIAVSQ